MPSVAQTREIEYKHVGIFNHMSLYQPFETEDFKTVLRMCMERNTPQQSCNDYLIPLLLNQYENRNKTNR